MARFADGQYLTAADATPLRVSVPMAVSMWWRGSATGNFRYLLSKLLLANEHPSYGFSTNASGDVRFIIGWGSSAGNLSISPASAGVLDNAWHHLLGTFDGTTVRFYVDGTEVGTGTTAGGSSVAYAALGIYLGSFDGTQLFAVGNMAETAVLSAIPTDDQRNALAKGFSPLIVMPDKVSTYWPLIGQNSPEPDVKAGINLTVTGPTQSEHSRVFNPFHFTPTVPAASGPLSGTIGQALETDTALAMSRQKARAIGQALETDTALPTGRAKARVIGQALETDSVLALVGRKVKVIGQASTIDTALSLSHRFSRTIGQALSTNIALPFGRLKQRTIGIATETDTAQIVFRPSTALARNPNVTVDMNRPSTVADLTRPSTTVTLG